MKDSNYLWNAEQTDFSLQAPHTGAWEDPGEWRLISYIAVDAGGTNRNLNGKQLAESVRDIFGDLNVRTANCRGKQANVIVLYGCPYAPLLQFALSRKTQLAQHLGGHIRRAGQLLVSLPPSAIPYFFWKHDVVGFKEGERSAARKICRSAGCRYDERIAPWDNQKDPLFWLKGGPSWRWWTRYLNEDVPCATGEWNPLITQ